MKKQFLLFYIITVASGCERPAVCYDVCYTNQEGNKKYDCEIISKDGCVAKVTDKKTGEVIVIDRRSID